MENLEEIEGDEHCGNCVYDDIPDGEDPCKTCITYDFAIKWKLKNERENN